MIETIQRVLENNASSPWILFLGIIFLSYLLEDLAIVTAGVLASQSTISPALGLLAIFVGISTGDLGLYFLGRYGRKLRCLRYKALKTPYFKVLQRRFKKGAFANLFVIRFVPGLRSVGFTLSGFFFVPIPLFLCAVLLATGVWTSAIFFAVYFLGSQVLSQATQYQWVLIPVALGVLFITNRFLYKSFSKGLS